MKTIGELESEIAARVPQLLKDLVDVPEDYKPYVRLRGETRDKRRTAAVQNFSLESDSIRIYFGPVPVAEQPHATTPFPNPRDEFCELIQALARAEARPGYTFVALKWFRDVALVQEGFAWASSHESRQWVLGQAIKIGIILTNRISNPRSPEHPVTAIRLNRLLPRVKTVLGLVGETDLDFHPVEIQGEPLSATVLRERR